MSMDYLKNVYVPKRDETRKITSYGYMNHWCEYSQPPSESKRPIIPLLDNSSSKHAPLGPGVDLQIPSPRQYTPLTKEMMRRRRQVAEKNDRELRQRFGCSKEAGQRLQPLSHSLDTTAYREEHTQPDGSIIIAGRKVVPDPMMQGASVHLGYSHSGGYDDYHKTFLKLQKDGIYPSYPLYGPPKARNGGVGGAWRHVKEVMQARGHRTVFVDGQQREIDNMDMSGGKVPGSDIFYPLKSDNGPLGRKAKRRLLTSPPNNMTAHDKHAMRQMEGANWHLLR